MKLLEYIIYIKIQCAIYQAMLESKNKEPDFGSINDLAIATACDTVKFLKEQKIIED